MPEATSVDRPIGVFISSSQKEFQGLRDRLKHEIDNEKFFEKYMMRAELVERRGGQRVGADITSGLEEAAIYLGIFGTRFSEVVEEEYEEARRRGLAIILFETVPAREDGSNRDARLKNLLNRVKRVHKFRVTPIIIRPSRPSGHASLDPRYRAVAEVITQRLANVVAEIVHENLRIRRIVNQ